MARPRLPSRRSAPAHEGFRRPSAGDRGRSDDVCRPLPTSTLVGADLNLGRCRPQPWSVPPLPTSTLVGADLNLGRCRPQPWSARFGVKGERVGQGRAEYSTPVRHKRDRPGSEPPPLPRRSAARLSEPTRSRARSTRGLSARAPRFLKTPDGVPGPCERFLKTPDGVPGPSGAFLVARLVPSAHGAARNLRSPQPAQPAACAAVSRRPS